MTGMQRLEFAIQHGAATEAQRRNWSRMMEQLPAIIGGRSDLQMDDISLKWSDHGREITP